MKSEYGSGWRDLGNPLRRVINPEDGRAFVFARSIPYLVLLFLCVCGIIVMVAPKSWFEGGVLLFVSDHLKESLSKLKLEAQFLDRISPMRGNKYVVLYAFSLLWVVSVLSLYSLPKLNQLLLKDGTKLTKFHKVHCWISAFLALVCCYLVFFDSNLVTSNATASRAIGKSGLIWFWPAFQATYLFECCHLVFAMFTKHKKFNQ